MHLVQSSAAGYPNTHIQMQSSAIPCVFSGLRSYPAPAKHDASHTIQKQQLGEAVRLLPTEGFIPV